MKKNYILLFLSVLFVYTTNAQTTLTNNVGSTIVPGASVSCPSGSNSFARQFALADFGIAGDFELTTGQFGIETISGAARSITVNVYTSDGNFPASYPGTLLGTQLVNVPATTADESVISYSFSTPITVAGTVSHIVVELVQAASDASSLFIGATAEQTAIGYLRSAPCGLTTYGDPATLGFPSAKFFITVSGNLLSIKDFSLDNSISIHPNPTNDVINLSVSKSVNINSVELYNIIGKLVLKTDNAKSLDLSHLESGVYLLKVSTDLGSLTKKVIRN